MGAKGLIVLVLGYRLIFGELRLYLTFPLGLTISLGLGKPRSTVSNSVVAAWGDDDTINGIIVRSRLFDVGCGVGVIIGGDMRRDCLLKLEVGLADGGRGFVTGFEGRWTPESNSDDRVPR